MAKAIDPSFPKPEVPYAPQSNTVAQAVPQNNTRFNFTWDIAKQTLIRNTDNALEFFFKEHVTNWKTTDFVLYQSADINESATERYTLRFLTDSKHRNRIKEHNKAKISSFHQAENCQEFIENLIKEGKFFGTNPSEKPKSRILSSFPSQHTIINVLTFSEIWDIIGEKEPSLTVWDLDETLVKNNVSNTTSAATFVPVEPAEKELGHDIQEFKRAYPQQDFVLITNSPEKSMRTKLAIASIALVHFTKLMPKEDTLKKSPRLEGYLEGIEPQKYKHIFIIDDQWNNISEMLAVCNARNIKATGIHFLGLMHHKHSNFRLELIQKGEISEGSVESTMEKVYAKYPFWKLELKEYERCVEEVSRKGQS